MARERAIAFVVARLDSQRLFAKQLREIGGRTMLDWVIDRLERSAELDGIVLATVDDPVNDPLEELAQRRGIACFRYAGEVDHVTTRLRRAAEAAEAEICVLVSADCPLVSSEAIDLCVRELREHPAADTCGAERDDTRLNLMVGTSVARLRCWQLADDLSCTPELREHQFPVIRQKEHLFHVHVFSIPDAYRGPLGVRLSVDTWADLELMNALHARLAAAGQSFELLPAVALLETSPDLVALNAHVHQRAVRERSEPVLFVVDAGGRFGYGHLMRCRELALQVIERTGNGVTFLVDDSEAVRLVEERGMRAEWGAMGRIAEPAPVGVTSELVRHLAAQHDLVVLDLFGGRELELGWRDDLDTRVAVIDRADGWALEAELVVLPGVTTPRDWTLPCTLPRGGTGVGETRVVGGKDHAILRRELRARAGTSNVGELGLLAYLHDARRREALTRFAERQGVRARVLDASNGLSDEFPDLLARARVFVSGFGIAFYEALAVGAYPVAWPLTEGHARDALRFYEVFGLDPVILERDADLGMLEAVLRSSAEVPRVEDGTRNIVEALFPPAESAPAGARAAMRAGGGRRRDPCAP